MPAFNPIGSTVSIAWESTFGTASTTNRFAPTLSGTVDVNREKTINPFNRFGSNVPVDYTPILGVSNTISISGFLTNLYWLRALTGSAQTITGTGPYTHTWNYSTTSGTTVSATIDVNDRRFAGCVIENASISCSIDDVARFNISFRSLFNPTGITPSAPATTGQDVFTYVGTALSGIGFTATDIVRSITINFTPNTEQLKRIGSLFPSTAVRRIFNITVDMEVLFSNYPAITDMLSGSYTKYSTITDAIIEMTNSSGNKTLRLRLRDIVYNVISWNETPENLIIARLSGVVRSPASVLGEMITDTNTAF
mgnify:CR=1 FL=1